jgi:hypothetical protein
MKILVNVKSKLLSLTIHHTTLIVKEEKIITKKVFVLRNFTRR